MKRIALCTTTVLLAATCFSSLLTSCSSKVDSSSSKVDSSSNELESQVDSASENSSGSNTPDSPQNVEIMYKKIQLDLPENVTDVPTKQFDVQDSSVDLISIGEDYFSYAVDITSNCNNPDKKIYKCDISSGETVELAGIMPNWNSGVTGYADCGDSVYMFYETPEDRILINFDFIDNKVNIIERNQIDFNTDSVYWSYTVNPTTYAVRWFNFDQYHRSILTHHMVLVDESGEKTEIFTDKTNSKKFLHQVAVTNGNIYRLFFNQATKEMNVSTYDLSGTLVDQDFLPEISNHVSCLSSPDLRQFAAAGSCVAITFYDTSTQFLTYIYNLEENTYIALDHTYVIYNASLNSFNGFVLERKVYDSDGSSTQDLLVLNTDSNSVYKIAGDLSSSLIAMTNGEKVAYRQDHYVTLCDISEL